MLSLAKSTEINSCNSHGGLNEINFRNFFREIGQEYPDNVEYGKFSEIDGLFRIKSTFKDFNKIPFKLILSSMLLNILGSHEIATKIH